MARVPLGTAAFRVYQEVYVMFSKSHLLTGDFKGVKSLPTGQSRTPLKPISTCKYHDFESFTLLLSIESLYVVSFYRKILLKSFLNSFFIGYCEL